MFELKITNATLPDGRKNLDIGITDGKIAAIEDLLKPYGVLELVRTGKIALQRGSGSVSSGR